MEEVFVEWTGTGFQFTGTLGEHRTPIDGNAETGPNPVALLLESVAACMAIDVVDILEKGRQDVRGLRVRTLARREESPPRFVRWLRLEFEIEGDVDEGKVERAVQLSFDKYCSVFHSMRQDIEVESSITVVSARGSAATAD